MSSDISHGAIRPVARHGVERVGRARDARLERNLGALEPVGHAAAVEALVVRAHDVERARRVAEQRRENAPAEHRMRHDVLVLLGRQSLGLVQHRLAHADLADVVHVPAELDLAKHLRRRGPSSCAIAVE